MMHYSLNSEPFQSMYINSAIRDLRNECFKKCENAEDDLKGYFKVKFHDGHTWFSVITDDAELDKVVKYCKKQRWECDRLKDRVIVIGKFDDAVFRIGVCISCGSEESALKNGICDRCEGDSKMIAVYKKYIEDEKNYANGELVVNFTITCFKNFMYGDYWKNVPHRVEFMPYINDRMADNFRKIINMQLKSFFKKCSLDVGKDRTNSIKKFDEWCANNQFKCGNSRKALDKYRKVMERSRKMGVKDGDYMDRARPF